MARHRASQYALLPDAKLELVRKLASQRADVFIQDKLKIPLDKSGEVVPFKYNWTQKRAYEIYQEELKSGKPIRLWFLKARRVGLTSVFAADDLIDAWSRNNRRVGIVAHNDDRARRILAMCKFFYKQLPPQYRLPLSKDATAGLKFADHDSELVIGTCKFPEKVRGDGLHRAHLSEAAWYQKNFGLVMNEVATTIAPEEGTAIIIETTGRNRGSACHKHWEASAKRETQYRAEFLAWIQDPTSVRPFTSDLQKKVIMDEIMNIEPRLDAKNRFFKLTGEQCHWAYWNFIHRCNLDFEYFCREFPYDVEEAWTSEGSSFFGDNEITKMTSAVQGEPTLYSFKGRFINQMFSKFSELEQVSKIGESDSALHIKLWKDPHGKDEYVIGADVSLGEAGSTFSAGYVIHKRTREMVCAYHGRIRPDEHAFVLASLGKIYNTAKLAPEVNPGGGGMSIITDLYRLGYHNIYEWRHRDKIGGPERTNAAGWWTTQATRPTILTELRKMFHDCAHGRFNDPGMFKDRALLNEMRSFHVDPESNRAEAAEDAYDDRIIGLAIAHRVAADEVMWQPDDIYLSYDTDKIKTPAQNYIDHINEMAKMYDGADPTDVISRFTARGFDLNEGTIEWHDSTGG
jgi:hypothetical protein